MYLTIDQLKLDRFPNTVKRAFISQDDSKMLLAESDHYIIKCNQLQFKKRWLANAYLQSDIFLRIISKMSDHTPNCMLSLGSDELARRHAALLKGDITWLQAFEGFIFGDVQKYLISYKRLLNKCYTFNIETYFCFGTDVLIKSYCNQIAHLPAVYNYRQVLSNDENKTALNKFRATWSVDPLACDANMLRLSPTFKALDIKDVDNWVNYMDNYSIGLEPEEKLLSIRDHAAELVAENGSNYSFLVKACKELLL